MGLWQLGILVAVVAVAFQLCPVHLFVPKFLHISPELTPAMHMNNLREFSGSAPSKFLGEEVTVEVGPLGFILIVKPPLRVTRRYTSDDVGDWLTLNNDWLSEHIVEYGGVLLRGFKIDCVSDFDDLVGVLHPDVNGTGIYLGTAPRVRIPNTRFVSSASEIPKIFSIPTHLELCFTPDPPPRLYFFAGAPNPPPGGQTPFTDFRQVWKDIPSGTRERLQSRGLGYERRYYNARPRMRFRSYDAWNLDALQHKSWQAMFGTKNRTLVELMANAQGFKPSWDAKYNLLLTHPADVFRKHPVTGDEYFSTHFNVLHAATHIVPFLWDAQLFNSRKTLVVGAIISLITQVRLLLGYPYGHDMVHTDDNTSVSFADGVAIRKVILQNTWQFDWEKGDMMMLDNLRTAHGRTPWFDGERNVYVAWN